MKRIVNPKWIENGEYRKHMNHEIKELMKGEDVVNFAIAKSNRWLGYIETRHPDVWIKMITGWILEESKPRGRRKQVGKTRENCRDQQE